MNPTELRMMWMSQYNPERISIEDAATFFGHPTVGLSVMDDLTAQQQQLDLNPMMGLVGGDFGNQAAAAAAAVAASSAAAALGVQPAALLAATNSSDIYGLAQMSGLQQQLLQQSAAVFQNYTDMMNDEDEHNINASTSGMNMSLSTDMSNVGALGGMPMSSMTDDNSVSGIMDEAQQLQQQSVYDQMDDNYEDGIDHLTPKQEIINIDDFVMLNDSSSYDDNDFVNADEQNIMHSIGQVQNLVDSDLLAVSNMSSANVQFMQNTNMLNNAKLQGMLQASLNSNNSNNVSPSNSPTPTTSNASQGNQTGGGGGGTGSSVRSQRKTRKIEPINRPGLVLKTPIAYKGNIDPSVIPIQKDGMAVCERCGAIGVKHTFYTKSRRFCSMACARGELYSLVLSNNNGNKEKSPKDEQENNNKCNNNNNNNNNADVLSSLDTPTDIELALRVAHIKHNNYRFRLADDNDNDCKQQQQVKQEITDIVELNENTPAANQQHEDASKLMPPPKPLRMYRDVLPQEELPQIRKFEQLPNSCAQLDKMLSVRRRAYEPISSFNWLSRLNKPNFFAAPVTCFKHAPGYEVWDNLDIDMKVEVENTDCDYDEVILSGQHVHSFWVASILKICGYKALMRYEGFEQSNRDFWVNLCSAEVHAVGWCATRGKPLIPPLSIAHKYRDWKDFLVARLSGARTLPNNFYDKINDSLQSRFRVGINLECVDKDHISQVRLATITKIVGKRLYCRYFDSEDGFWCHEDSPIIHPVGWATTVGHNLAAPQDYLQRMLAGRSGMIEVHEDDATIELFKMNFTFEEYYMDGKTNSFMEGMKLEAVDPLNLSSICAATVMAVLKFGYIMIRIDSYQPDATNSDWFCYHEKSPSIFPVGFCQSNNIALTPPNNYESSKFSWDAYMRETGSVAAPPHLFHRIVPDHHFEVGMSLECADLMDPRLICVATVVRVTGRLLRIHFDGWTDDYDQWLDCESPDIYPVGWCVLVNHKLEGPPAALQNVKPAAVATTATKKSHRRRKKKTALGVNTTTTTGATSAMTTNVNAKSTKQQQVVKPQDPQPHNKQQQQQQLQSDANSVKPRTIPLRTNPDQPKLSIKLELKPEHYNAAYYDNNAIDEDDDDGDDDDDETDVEDDVILIQTPSPTTSIASKTSNRSAHNSNNQQQQQQQQHKLSTKSIETQQQQHQRLKTHSTLSSDKYIPRLSDCSANESVVNTLPSTSSNEQIGDLVPDTWNIYDVTQFLRVNDCSAYSETFSRNEIDGKRLLQLSKDEIITLLGMKVGPALKIYDLIQQLKCKVNPNKSRQQLHKPNKSLTSSYF